ncbi:galectin-3-like [Hippocampus comes]|uniref:galectin-3-like n=1 Tax=Hippocampus comes TaxID=109280 RepID=UPI00094E9251|nr:PREDICTED: galectin-3-like [Hippocampus comes]
MYLHLLMAILANFLQSTVMSDTELQCDVNNGWQPYCSHCYLMAGDLSWSEAEKYCVNHKAHLASVHSEAELDFLTNLLVQSGRCSAWLGVSIEWWDMFFYWDYDFRNTDNTTADYFRWNKREPNNAFRKEECVELTRDGHLNDYICKVEQQFICKKAKDFRPPPPTCPQCNCPTWVAPTPCPPLAPPSLPPAHLTTSGPGSVILWNEKSYWNHMHVDIKGSCMLVASPHWFGFIVDLLGYLSAGRSIAIRGRVKPSAERLIFKLIAAKGTALHLDFNIKDQKIVMASNLNGAKDKEETTLDSFPIEPGLDFEIIIQCDVDCFYVTVNGVQQLDFTNRLRNVQSIRMLKMWRDMLLTDVTLM